MSEKLEEKYMYMCKMVEEMASSLNKADKMFKDWNQMIAENERLKDYIDNMCGMIEAETPLKEHDRWLDDCIAQGFYKKEQEGNE